MPRGIPQTEGSSFTLIRDIRIGLPDRLLTLTLGPNLYNKLTIFVILILKNKPPLAISGVPYPITFLSADLKSQPLSLNKPHASLLGTTK